MKKILTILLIATVTLSMCSCRRKQPATNNSDVTSSETEQGVNETDYSDPKLSDQTSETTDTDYTFQRETTAPINQKNVDHKYYSVDEVMTILLDISTIKTGDSGKAYWDKITGYQNGAPEQSPVFSVEACTPGEWCPSSIQPIGNFTITEGSYVVIKMFIYDKEVMEGVYSQVVERIKTVCGGIEVDEYHYSNFDNIKRVTSDSSSPWDSECYIEIEKDTAGRWDMNGYYVNVCLPVPMK